MQAGGLREIWPQPRGERALGVQCRAQPERSSQGRKEPGSLGNKKGGQAARAERWRREVGWDIKAPFGDKSSPTLLRGEE